MGIQVVDTVTDTATVVGVVTDAATATAVTEPACVGSQ